MSVKYKRTICLSFVNGQRIRKT